ncbi:hypothetical protein [Streptomyces sp. NPDC054866]
MNVRRISSVRLSPAGRKAVSFALVGATAATVLTAMTSPASALSWKCNTSSQSIDDRSYSGPAPDNIDIKIKNCVARSGSYVYAKATMSFDFPPTYAGGDIGNTMTGATMPLYVKRSDAGADTLLGTQTYNVRDNFQRMNGSGNGTFTTSTMKKRVGSGRFYTDSAIKINWVNDGKGYFHYGFEASGTR